jgi:hypothetical protein
MLYVCSRVWYRNRSLPVVEVARVHRMSRAKTVLDRFRVGSLQRADGVGQFRHRSSGRLNEWLRETRGLGVTGAVARVLAGVGCICIP